MCDLIASEAGQMEAVETNGDVDMAPHMKMSLKFDHIKVVKSTERRSLTRSLCASERRDSMRRKGRLSVHFPAQFTNLSPDPSTNDAAKLPVTPFPSEGQLNSKYM